LWFEMVYFMEHINTKMYYIGYSSDKLLYFSKLLFYCILNIKELPDLIDFNLFWSYSHLT